jgi:hypothetical protein
MSTTMSGATIGINNNDLVCQHPDHVPVGHRTTWCEHILEAIENGDDAILIHPEHTYHVPVFPTVDKYAIVRLGEALNSPIKMCEMNMLYTPDIGQGKTIPLGYWVEGDSFMTFRACVIDYMKSMLDPDEILNTNTPIRTICPQVQTDAHSMIAQKRMKAIGSIGEKVACLWDMVFEKACTFCREASADPNSNFGVGF